jgi:sensor domain CHASE-containing protein
MQCKGDYLQFLCEATVVVVVVVVAWQTAKRKEKRQKGNSSVSRSTQKSPAIGSRLIPKLVWAFSLNRKKPH